MGHNSWGIFNMLCLMIMIIPGKSLADHKISAMWRHSLINGDKVTSSNLLLSIKLTQRFWASLTLCNNLPEYSPMSFMDLFSQEKRKNTSSWSAISVTFQSSLNKKSWSMPKPLALSYHLKTLNWIQQCYRIECKTVASQVSRYLFKVV